MSKLSYSEASTLSQCEMKWALTYGREERTPPTPAMQKGTLIHKWYEGWLRREGMNLPESWVDEYTLARGATVEEATVYLNDFPEEVIDDAEWLMNRFVQHYGEEPPSSWEIIAIEQFGSFRWNGVDVQIRTDGLIRIDGKLWLDEVKSYGRNTRLQLVTVHPQETLYLYGVEQITGERPYGILFDGIYTYRWVKDRPVEDSFQRIWEDRSNEQVENALNWITNVIERRDMIASTDDAIANIGPLCNGCGVRRECFQRLLSIDDEIEVVEED